MPRSLGKALDKALWSVQAANAVANSWVMFLYRRRINRFLAGVDTMLQMEGQQVVKYALKALKDLHDSQSGYLPLGRYHLLLEGHLDSVDSACQRELLDFGLVGLIASGWKAAQDSSSSSPQVSSGKQAASHGSGSSTAEVNAHQQVPDTTTASDKEAKTLLGELMKEYVEPHTMDVPESELKGNAEDPKAKGGALKEPEKQKRGPTYISALEAVYKRVQPPEPAGTMDLRWTSHPQKIPSSGEHVLSATSCLPHSRLLNS